jgi:hypothetical protein
MYNKNECLIIFFLNLWLCYMLDHKNEKETSARSQGHSRSRQSKTLMSFQILLKLGSYGVAQ